MSKVQLCNGALILLLAGCGLNRADLVRDVLVLLKRCNVEPETVTATMSDRSRTGIVECAATAEEVSAIVNGLGLQEAGASTEDPDLRRWLEDGTSQFDHPLLSLQEGIVLFRSARRSQSLHLPDGSSFEYVLLFWDREKGRVLFQLSYAYG